MVPSSKLDKALDKLFDLINRDFIATWYNKISLYDQNFPQEIRSLFGKIVYTLTKSMKRFLFFLFSFLFLSLFFFFFIFSFSFLFLFFFFLFLFFFFHLCSSYSLIITCSKNMDFIYLIFVGLSHVIIIHLREFKQLEKIKNKPVREFLNSRLVLL